MTTSKGETQAVNENYDVGTRQSPEKPKSLATSTHVIDPRGDLWVSVSGPGSWGVPISMRLQVCSRALARNSRVFDKMLYGGFAESRGGSKEQAWEVDLPSDSARAMKQLFEILHCTFAGVSQDDDGNRISIGQKTEVEEGDATGKDGSQRQKASSFIPHLYDLIVLADKYDCIGALQFSANAWLFYVDNEVLRTKTDPKRAAWLYYQLGDHESYSKIVTRLAMEFPSSPDSRDEEVMVLPPQLLDSVEALRLHILSKMLAAIENTVSGLISAGAEEPLGFCIASNLKAYGPQYRRAIRLSCEAELLGVTLRGLYKQKLWPIRDPEAMMLPPKSYITSIIDELSTPKVKIYTRNSHESCVPKFNLGTTELGEPDQLWDRYVPNEEELRYMEQQRNLTGVKLVGKTAGKDQPPRRKNSGDIS